MTGDETWTVDGTSLNTAQWWMRTWNGLDVVPGVNISGASTGGSGTNGFLQLAQQHGEFWYPQFTTASMKRLTMFVSAIGPAGAVPTSVDQARQYFDANLDALTELFYRRRNLLTIVRTLSSGAQRKALATCSAILDPALVPVTQAEVTFELTLPDGFWRDVTDTTLVPTIAAGFNGTVSALAAATAPMNDLTFTVTGPITNPRITDNESGSWVQYTGTVSTGQTLVVNNSTMAVSGTGGLSPSLTNMSHAGESNWLTLYPTYASGVSLQFTGTSTTGATNLAVFGHMKYQR